MSEKIGSDRHNHRTEQLAPDVRQGVEGRLSAVEGCGITAEFAREGVRSFMANRREQEQMYQMTPITRNCAFIWAIGYVLPLLKASRSSF